MSTDKFLEKREKALENSFFAKQDHALVDRLRKKREKSAARKALVDLAGVGDVAVLDRLVDLEIGPDTWSAVALVPLVETAWADGEVDARQRRAVLTALEAGGAGPSSPAYQLLENWLANRPGPELRESWSEYIKALCRDLSPGDKEALKAEVLGRARHVAEVAGGFLGFGRKIDNSEADMLETLGSAFE